MVEVGDSVLVENNNEMIPAKVEHISIYTDKGNVLQHYKHVSKYMKI